MREYGYEAVLKSRQQMDGNAPIHRPYVGRVLLALQRVINATPPIKRKMAESLSRFRGSEREDEMV